MAKSLSFLYPSDPGLQINAEPVEPSSDKGTAFHILVNGSFAGYIIKKKDNTYSKLGYVKLTEEQIQAIGDGIEQALTGKSA